MQTALLPEFSAGTQSDSPSVPPPPLPLTRRQPSLWLTAHRGRHCQGRQHYWAREGPGHGTFVGGCVCCGSGGCSVVPIGSSNRGLVTPQPQGMRTRGGKEGMREGQARHCSQILALGDHRQPLPGHRATRLDGGWGRGVLALSSVPEPSGKRRKERTDVESDPALLTPSCGTCTKCCFPTTHTLS